MVLFLIYPRKVNWSNGMVTEQLGPPGVSKVQGLLGKLLLKIMGWQVKGEVPQIPKFVAILAPHTSYFDAPLMIALASAVNVKCSIFIKEEAFIGPLSSLLRFLGGVPIRRGVHSNTVAATAHAIKAQPKITVGIPPEGTRRAVEYWKSGFYHIALQAEVPILFTYLDYKNKIAGVGPLLYPTGDIHADMEIIRAYYTGIQGRHPDRTGPIRVRPDAVPSLLPKRSPEQQSQHRTERTVLQESG
jgi:1-acyl-sn-glycerol-3-phosphate acyltransferase